MATDGDAPLATTATLLADGRRDVVAAAPWGGDAVFVGLDGGAVLLLRRAGGEDAPPPPAPRGAGDRVGADAVPPWRVAGVYTHVAQKRVLQLEVAPTLNCLLALTDDGVSAFRLPALTLVAQADRTRGATRFAWRPPRLAAAVKRRVLLFRHDGLEFAPTREVGLAEPVLALAWAGDTALAAGASRAWWGATEPGGAPVEVLDDGTAAITVDGGVALVGGDGRVARGARRAWRGAGAPAALAAAGPLVAAALPGGVEVRLLHPGVEWDPITTLPLACMAVASTGGGGNGGGETRAASAASPFIVAGGPRAVAVAPLPPPSLAAAAAAAGHHADAVALAGLTPPGPARAAAVAAARRGLAASLFVGGDYDGALAQLGMVGGGGGDTDGVDGGGGGGGGVGGGAVLALLRLFPSIAPPDLLDGLDDDAAPPAPAAAPAPPPPPEPTGDAYVAAVSALLPYLVTFRGRLAAAARAAEGSGDGGGAASAPPPAATADALAVAVDTAILHAMLVGPDSGAALRFAGAPNRVSLRHGEVSLRAAGRYSELVALLRGAGRHEDALDLLRSLSTAPDSLPVPPTGAAADLAGVTGAWAAARHLHAVGGARPDLVHAHARWVVAADDDAGLRLLLELVPPPPPDAALAVLRGAAPRLRAPYLEAALEAGIADPARWHGELAGLYVRGALEAGQGGNEPAPTPAPPPAASSPAPSPTAHPVPGTPAAYARLLALIRTSPHIDAGRLLALLPPGALPAARALLLGRLGRHEDALRVAAVELRDDALAEELADRAAQGGGGGANGVGAPPSPSPPSSAPAHLDLLRLLLERDGGPRPRGPGIAAAARLLARRPGSLDPAAALALLPDDAPLADAAPYVTGTLRAARQARVAATLARGLARSAGLAARGDADAAAAGCVLVTDDRACARCARRLGGAAFALLPGGGLAHYACMAKEREKE